MLQGEKTEALQLLIQQMAAMPDTLLLRHGEIRKSNGDGANLLRGKNTDQLTVTNVDPVVARKIQIKIDSLMPTTIPAKYQRIMNEVISDTTKFLAVHLLQPEVVRVCKCMKNVFVQCELWCEEILSRVSKPCCTCSRQVSTKALSDLVIDKRVRAAASGPGAFAGPHIDIEIRPCPAAQSRSRHEPPGVCPGSDPTSGCRDKASYMLYSTEYDCQRQYVEGPTRLPRPAADSYNCDTRLRGSSSPECTSSSRYLSDMFGGSPAGSSPSEDRHEVSSGTSGTSYYTSISKMLDESQSTLPSVTQSTTMHAQIWPECSRFAPSMTEVGPGAPRYTIGKEAYKNRAPIVTTDQMADWHAMMVSLTWNVQGWRNWIQETIDRALVSRSSSDDASVGVGEENWSVFCRSIETEAVQWRQYYLFSRQLALRLALRYRDKQIVSPTRASVKTGLYMQCQNEMLDIINMFNRWTHWLSVIVKESDTIECPSRTDGSYCDMRWSYFKNKVEENADDWMKYNMHLKVCWEQKYINVMKDRVPTWSQPRPMWVMSAGGAVPSGAVAAGVADGEPTWVARTTHDTRVLPAALRPSKRCCILYADSAVHHYKSYQVLCNANVLWVPWRATWMSARAVSVAPGVYVGRVLYRGAHLLGAVRAPIYRCHVIIFGRPFAFNCYELLVLAELC